MVARTQGKQTQSDRRAASYVIMEGKRMKKVLATVLAACVLLPGLALAGVSFEGTVVSKDTSAVMAPFGGVVSAVMAQAGDMVQAGDVLAEVTTQKVYAETAGEVTGVFGQTGDYAENVAERYGAVLYITPERKYTITADTSKGYDTSDNLYVHLGEAVYLRSITANNNEGTGIISAVSGEEFTVETTSGEFWIGETVSVYRDPDYAETTRIGRGTIGRAAEVAVTGSGSIVRMAVKDGDIVTRGQLLYETVSGELDSLVADGNQIKSTVSGIVESINLTVGASVSKGALVVTICPADQMQVLVEINEYDLADVKVGDTVSLSFNYDDLGTNSVTGTVAMISDISYSTDASDVTYDVYVDFQPNADIRLGMTAMMETMDEQPAPVVVEEPAPEVVAP
jgi:multidrug efflux pump subunit AcrA (membrane-fusion protein)